jgi:hypothetical protein
MYIYVSFKVLVCIVVRWIVCRVIVLAHLVVTLYVFVVCEFVVRCICWTGYLLYCVFVVL